MLTARPMFQPPSHSNMVGAYKKVLSSLDSGYTYIVELIFTLALFSAPDIRPSSVFHSFALLAVSFLQPQASGSLLLDFDGRCLSVNLSL